MVYVNTLITVAPDCTAAIATQPPLFRGKQTVAGLQHELLINAPCEYDQDALNFEVHCRRKGIKDRAAEYPMFFAKEHPCLRASPLTKTYGWGAHYDADGRIGLIGVETAEYKRLEQELQTRPAMRSRRG